MNARALIAAACLALAPWASVRAATPKPVEPGLTAGPHTFTVHLAANDHTPIGEPQAVSVTVP